MKTIGRKWFFGSAMVALALPAIASAQYGQPTPTPPQSMPDHGQPAQPAQAAAPTAATPVPELIAAATCVIGRNATAADTLLASAPFSTDERQLAVHLIGDMQRCQHRPPISSSAGMIRGAFAEVVVEARFPAPQAPRSPAADVVSVLRLDQATTIANPATLAPAYALTDCTARQHPELIRAVLATEPASAAASAAIAALNPAFIACVTPGTQLNVDGRMLRGMLAESLYRWSVVQRDGSASPLAAVPAAAPATASAGH